MLTNIMNGNHQCKLSFKSIRVLFYLLLVLSVGFQEKSTWASIDDPFIIEEGGAVFFAPDDFKSSNYDISEPSCTLVVIENPKNGYLFNNENTRLIQFSFDNIELSRTIYGYAHYGGEQNSDSFTLLVKNRFEETIGIFKKYIIINPVNDRPVIYDDTMIVPSDTLPQQWGSYGVVAIDGDTVAIGSLFYQNMVYVFTRINDKWVNTAKLIPSGMHTTVHFGSSLAISGDTIVVGDSANEIHGQAAGRAFVYKRPLDGWKGTLTESARLSASDARASQRFSKSVSLSGNVVVCGSALGGAYVFVEPELGWSGDVTETSKLIPTSNYQGDFGSPASISGDVIVVGARLDDQNGMLSGALYVYTKPKDGWKDTISPIAELRASDGGKMDTLGYSVAIEGDVIVAGVPWDNEKDNASGSVYVFVKPLEGWSGNQLESARLIASDPKEFAQFGEAVYLSKDVVVVGALYDEDQNKFNFTGSAYVFKKPVDGWKGTLTQNYKLFASNKEERSWFGSCVASFGNTILVGAQLGGFIGSDSGCAYVFDVNQLDSYNRTRYKHRQNVIIDSTISLFDSDSPFLQGAKISFISSFVPGEDVLDFVNQNGIAGEYRSASGELILSGTATIEQYQAALRSVTYTNTSMNPNRLERVVRFEVNDGFLDSHWISQVIAFDSEPYLTPTPTATPEPERTPSPIASLMGDSNRDGILDNEDVRMILLLYLQDRILPPAQHSIADFNQDGRITPQDSQNLFLYIKGRQNPIPLAPKP